jgi:hypothetical protein
MEQNTSSARFDCLREIVHSENIIAAKVSPMGTCWTAPRTHLQSVVDLCTHLHGLSKCFCTHWKNHELLQYTKNSHVNTWIFASFLQEVTPHAN